MSQRTQLTFTFACSSNICVCSSPVNMTWVRMTSMTVCRVRTMVMTSMRTSSRWKYDNPWWERCVFGLLCYQEACTRFLPFTSLCVCGAHCHCPWPSHIVCAWSHISKCTYGKYVSHYWWLTDFWIALLCLSHAADQIHAGECCCACDSSHSVS